MDALSEILNSLRMRHAAVGMLHLSAPWGLNSRLVVPTAFGVVEGSCWLRVPDREAIQLGVGDMALVNGPHQLLWERNARAEDMMLAWIAQGLPVFEPDSDREPQAPVHFRQGGGGAETRLLGLAFGLAGGRLNPLVASLPPCIVLRSGGNGFSWMRPAIEFLSFENAGSPGYTATAHLLAELVFVSIVRTHLLNESKGSRGWLRGLADPHIAKALLAIHREPGAEWTVGSLAREAGLSRTVFAARFGELVEATPIDYLTQWRMHLAAERIAQSHPNLTQLAFELGYASDAAFREAFKRRYGVAPSRYGLAPEPQRAELAASA